MFSHELCWLPDAKLMIQRSFGVNLVVSLGRRMLLYKNEAHELQTILRGRGGGRSERRIIFVAVMVSASGAPPTPQGWVTSRQAGAEIGRAIFWGVGNLS